MRHKSIVTAAFTAIFALGTITIAGCGGGNSGGGGGTTPPSISSFSSSPAIVTDGASAKLTGVFANGTGVITPGTISATSGTAVSVTAPNDTTTTYTLTVSGASGTTPATATTTVQAVAAPSITSFAASPASIATGASSSLTAVFTGGTGVITPGNLPVTSGTAVSVNPTTTTTYTLTVTNAATTAVTQTATVTVTAGPAITSFTAAAPTITVGGSTTLTAVFSGGTGVITGGSFSSPVTSGTAVTVTPAITTTYTLTVTPASGMPQTQTVTVTVVPAPVITSFSANPTSISSGGTSNLTGAFTGGTGVITPGNLTVTSGNAVSVTPATTTTYTLTVTNAANTAVTSSATVTVITATVTVNPAVPGLGVTDQLLGMNAAAWYDQAANASTTIAAFNMAGIKAIRWPGGSWSDDYHWGYQTGSSTLVTPYMCQSASDTGGVTGGWGGNDTFAQFVNALPLAGPYDLALTANYGSNEACTGGGDPKEAAAWAAAALADGITPSHITVGNEEYGSWESDLHAIQHDPTTYANSVIGPNGYYSLIKAQSPNTLVGVIVDAGASNGCCTADWDPTVLGGAAGSYDFVEFHFYPQNPQSLVGVADGENDSFLVTQAAQELTQDIKTIQSELTAVSKPNTPIYVGEMGSVSSNPGIQSWSITQGLFAGQVLGEMMNDGVSRATWWIGFGNCNGDAGAPWNQNSSASTSGFYGWQDFGAYNVFADASGDVGGGTSGPPAYPNTPCNYGGPIGTMSPTAEAFNLFQNVAVTGEHVLTPSVTGDTTDVRAYAATHSGGSAIVLFNVNETTSQSVTVTVSGENDSSDVKVITYDKALYDQTNATPPVWVTPKPTDLGSQTLPLTVTLPPWSMNVILIQ